jgi:hypothetical protein
MDGPTDVVAAWKRFDDAARDAPLGTLQVWDELENEFTRLREDLIIRAREDRLSWSVIAEAIGCSRQAAWERYGYFDDELAEYRLDDAESLGPRLPSPPRARRLRRDAEGLGDDERYLRDQIVSVFVDGVVRCRSGVRSPRGADLNQIQTWVANEVGHRHPGNSRLIHNLRLGSTKERVENVTVVVEAQPG